MMAAYLPAWRGPRRGTLRLIARYAAAIVLTVVFLFPVYWLFMIVVQDAGRDLRIRRRSGTPPASNSPISQCSSRTVTR